MAYNERGKHNPFDAYMAGFCWWQSPRQILINEKALKSYTPEPGVETEAYEDMLSQIEHEAEIKRRKFSELQPKPVTPSGGDPDLPCRCVGPSTGRVSS